MTYIVLELFPIPCIVTNEHGQQYQFEDLVLAKKLAEECQQGMVVPLDTNLISNLEWIYAYQKYIEKAIKCYVE